VLGSSDKPSAAKASAANARNIILAPRPDNPGTIQNDDEIDVSPGQHRTVVCVTCGAPPRSVDGVGQLPRYDPPFT